MGRTKALPECARGGCRRDGTVRGRWCPEHATPTVPEACDAAVIRKRDGVEVTASCGATEGTIAFTPHWLQRASGRMVRCPQHRGAESLRNEFGQATAG